MAMNPSVSFLLLLPHAGSLRIEVIVAHGWCSVHSGIIFRIVAEQAKSFLLPKPIDAWAAETPPNECMSDFAAAEMPTTENYAASHNSIH
jgi:hypothetical protein